MGIGSVPHGAIAVSVRFLVVALPRLLSCGSTRSLGWALDLKKRFSSGSCVRFSSKNDTGLALS